MMWSLPPFFLRLACVELKFASSPFAECDCHIFCVAFHVTGMKAKFRLLPLLTASAKDLDADYW